MDLRVISLGAGVQSTTMYLRACVGELTPKPDAAIFADTQAEPPGVYRHLAWLRANFSKEIPIRVVTAGSLERNLFWGGEGRSGFAQIPAFLDGSGQRGMGPRQCTYQFKILPIQREVRCMLGLEKGERAAGRYQVEQWIGISVDEAHRAKDSDVSWITRRYPLLFDDPMRRGDCLEWLRQNGFPLPAKSSCYFCPYTHDRRWLEMKQREPEMFARAVAFDEALRNGAKCGEGLNGQQYLHASLQPLGDVEFRNENQPDLFGNECEGVCGV